MNSDTLEKNNHISRVHLGYAVTGTLFCGLSRDVQTGTRWLPNSSLRGLISEKMVLDNVYAEV